MTKRLRRTTDRRCRRCGARVAPIDRRVHLAARHDLDDLDAGEVSAAFGPWPTIEQDRASLAGGAGIEAISEDGEHFGPDVDLPAASAPQEGRKPAATHAWNRRPFKAPKPTASRAG